MSNIHKLFKSWLVKPFSLGEGFGARPALAFHLSPFAFLLPFSFLLFAFSLASCSLNGNMQGKGEGYLQGVWQQDSVPAEKQLLNYSLYNLKFDCDSFFIQVNTYSKVNTGADSCMSSGHWTEYIKGHYQQRNDTLHLKGQFCNADHSLKNEGGCFRSGVYEELFTISKKSNSVIQFSGTSSVIPIKARLIKRTTCKPKSF